MHLLTTTVGECLNKAAMRNPSGVALITSQSGASLTWQELNDEVHQVARGLLVAGLKKGDRLGLWSANSVEWIVCFLAAANIGVVVIGLNFQFQKREILNLLRLTHIDALCFSDGFRDNDFAAVVAELVQETSLSHLRLTIALGNKTLPCALSLNEIKALGTALSSRDYQQAQAQVQSSDLLTLQLTSGSTAAPKRVMLSHHSVINNALFSAQRLGVTHTDTLCLAVPLFHCFGLSSGLLFALHQGCKIVLLDNYSAEAVLRAVERYRCTILHGVPTIFSRLMQHDAFTQYDISSLDKGIVAGAYCSPRLISDITQHLGMRHLAVSYGQTETSPCCTQTLFNDPLVVKCFSVGKPLPFVEIKIIHTKSGALCPSGVSGEICSRGFHVMQGYDDAPEQTRAVLDSEGWLHTGDVGFMDVEGYLHYSYRLKEIIVRGGENISPREIEEAILEYPGVEIVKVFGIASEALGEEIIAALSVKPGYHITESMLRDFLIPQLARYKIPAHFHFLEQFPYTPCGKIDVQQLKLLTHAVEVSEK